MATTTRSKIVAGLSTLGATTAVGAMTFAGTLAIASWPVALVMTILVMAIDGEIKRKSSFAAVDRWLGRDQLTDLKRAIAKRELEKLRQQTTGNAFLTEYFTQKQYLHDLEHLGFWEKYYKRGKELTKVQRRVAAMEDFFVHWLLNGNGLQPATPMERAVSQLIMADAQQVNSIVTADKANQEIAKKMTRLKATRVFSALGGLGASLAISSACITTVVPLVSATIAASTALSWTLVGPFAALFFLGYTLMLHNAVSDMIKNDTVQKWVTKTGDWLKKQPDESRFKCNLRRAGVVLGILVLGGLAVFATLSTAGAWWFAAKRGLEKIPAMVDWIANTIRAITVTVSGMMTFLFNGVSALKTLKLVSHYVYERYRRTAHYFSSEYKAGPDTESWWQFLNPFRFLLTITGAVLFAFHLLGPPLFLKAEHSHGEESGEEHFELLEFIPEDAGLVLNTIHEGAVDVANVTEEGEEEPDEERQPLLHAHAHDHSAEDIELDGKQEPAPAPSPHQPASGHQHDHSEGLIKALLWVPSSILKLLAVAWEIGFGFAWIVSLWSPSAWHPKASWNKFFPDDPVVDKVTVSKEWTCQQHIQACDQEMAQLSGEDEKIVVQIARNSFAQTARSLARQPGASAGDKGPAGTVGAAAGMVDVPIHDAPAKPALEQPLARVAAGHSYKNFLFSTAGDERLKQGCVFANRVTTFMKAQAEDDDLDALPPPTPTAA